MNKSRNVGTDKTLSARTRTLFSSIRDGWCIHYKSRMGAIEEGLKLAVTCFPDVKLFDPIVGSANFAGYPRQSSYITGLITEWYVALSKYLSYRWFKIMYKIPGLEDDDKDAMDDIVEVYINWLSTCSFKDITTGLIVDPKLGQWDSNSHLKKDADSHVSRLLSEYKMVIDIEHSMNELLVDCYMSNYDRVVSTVKEVLNEDWHFLAINRTEENLEVLKDDKKEVVETPIQEFIPDHVMFAIKPTRKIVERESKEEIEWSTMISNADYVASVIEDKMPLEFTYLFDISKVKKHNPSIREADAATFKRYCMDMALLAKAEDSVIISLLQTDNSYSERILRIHSLLIGGTKKSNNIMTLR